MSSRDPYPTNPITVFIVDDHPMIRTILSTMLEGEKRFRVVGEAESANEAFEAMKLNPPDLVLVDIVLRNSSGLTLIKDIAQHLPRVRIMAISMHDEPSVIESALRRGAHGYVSKVEPTEVVLQAIQVVLSGKRYACPEILARLTQNADTPDLRELVSLLSEREREVFTRLGRGQPTRQIAEEMVLGFKTVQTYCARIKLKLKLEHGAALVTEAARWVAAPLRQL